MPNLELKIPPPIVGILTALAMIGATLLGQLPLPLPLLWRLPCAIFMFGAALAIGIICKRQFARRNTTWLPMEPKKTTSLVIDGIYRYTRNPMYLAGTLFLLGIGIALGDILALALVPCFMVYIRRFQIMPEERALEGLFGDAYREYKRRVRRWI